MIEKIKTALWFARRPTFWPHAAALVGRKLNHSARHDRHGREAGAWAAERAISAEEVLTRIGLFDPASGQFPHVPKELIDAAQERAHSAAVSMGGPADLDLLYAIVVLTQPRCVVETGVAYGWSSLVILAALERNGLGKLVSVDMPYVKRGNDPWVGVVVPDRLRHRWTLIRRPDRNGINRAIAECGGSIDLAHYDSDKSYAGRAYAYPRLWNALRSGGIFVSDDIQDNFGFRDFCCARNLPFQVTESAGKFIGLARKP